MRERERKGTSRSSWLIQLYIYMCVHCWNSLQTAIIYWLEFAKCIIGWLSLTSSISHHETRASFGRNEIFVLYVFPLYPLDVFMLVVIVSQKSCACGDESLFTKSAQLIYWFRRFFFFFRSAITSFENLSSKDSISLTAKYKQQCRKSIVPRSTYTLLLPISGQIENRCSFEIYRKIVCAKLEDKIKRNETLD